MKDSLTPRLLAASSHIRRGAVLADIGTDHAYLPIYLVENKIADRAVAADINEGPIERARVNIELAGLSDYIDTVCTDGLCGIEEYMPTDISICGMGGELICKILEKADFVKDEKIRLVLQPMTASSELYIWLLASGFRIISESYALEGSRSYRIMCAEYCGEPDAADICDAFAGTGEMTREHKEYVTTKLATLERRIAGIKITGKNVSMLEYIRDKIKSIIE